MKNKVLVLMSTYNGSKYLKEQLNSLYNQKDVELDILIRDDGSTDNTVEIIKKEQKTRKNIKLQIGDNVGYAKSFWWLVKNCSEEYDYYAFCDQDDIWNEKKIYRGTELLSKIDKNLPSLYTSRVESVNNDNIVLNSNTFNTYRAINAYESLQKSYFPGCVFIFNNLALKQLKRFNGYVISHDWAVYSIISLIGKTVYDSNSYIRYRIHNNNTIGNSSTFTNFKRKMKRFFSKKTNYRSNFTKDVYECYKSIIPHEYYDDLESLAFYRNNLKKKIKLILSNKFKGFIFKFLVLLNRV